ncbi:MAG: methionyl aminopeptidase [Epulopiscium sp.]|nr:methionyl aminopeptidase [Candidatus Epulonipiscium sp.]
MKIGRNDPCWCGSKKKYKACHIAFDEKINSYAQKGFPVPSHAILKTPAQLEGIRESGKINTAILYMVAEKIHAGMSTEEINTLVHEFTIAHNAIPATLNYKGYPKSVCTSINNEVCHGIPDANRILKNGDIINVDVTTIYNGYYADASRMFCIGEVSPEAKKLVDVTKECLELGLKAVKPWGFLGDIGAVIQAHAEKHGYSVVENIGGHGVGLSFHEEPYVCHIGKPNTGMLLVPGMVFTIEPMINAGTSEVYEDADNGWTIYTDDGSLSAQWEYTVAVTEDGAEILTR